MLTSHQGSDSELTSPYKHLKKWMLSWAHFTFEELREVRRCSWGSQVSFIDEVFRPQRHLVDFYFHSLALAQEYHPGGFFEGHCHYRICCEMEVGGEASMEGRVTSHLHLHLETSFNQ